MPVSMQCDLIDPKQQMCTILLDAGQRVYAASGLSLRSGPVIMQSLDGTVTRDVVIVRTMTTCTMAEACPASTINKYRISARNVTKPGGLPH